MHNKGNYVVSLGNVCRWLAQQAEELGVEIYPGFAAAEVLYDATGRVVGVATGDMGVGRDGQPTENYQPGVELRATYTIFAEGCRGSLTKTLFERFNLRDGADPQTFGLGIKELWEVEPAKHKPGLVLHTVGWPLDRKTYGGSFLYHMDDNQVAVGFVVGLDYQNPHLSPFDEMQRFKTHPAIRPTFEGGRRIAYGARALAEGGYQSVPRLVFPGGALIGDTAGFLNVPKIKGTHTAMKSGMVCAEAVFEALTSEQAPPIVEVLSDGLEGYLALGRAPPGAQHPAVVPRRPMARHRLFRDRYVCVARTGALDVQEPRRQRHAEARRFQSGNSVPEARWRNDLRQAVVGVHLQHQPWREPADSSSGLNDPAVPVAINLARYDGPEARYCPAGVYEFVEDDGAKRLQINAANCVHCKTCDIKDPTQNINWVVPEGGDGPNYPNM